MNIMSNLLDASVAVIGGADGPTAITVSGDLPVPAITVALFAIGFILYVYIAKAINSRKAPAQTVAAPVAAPAAAPASAVYAGPVLTGVEEKQAAVIMAIVSDKTGIPLSRLKFHSIKLMEDK
ncbi:MAG: hypothetical protein J6Q79_09125 [Clostridia bacterium]|nr:hypothetical protein [Clostridia bacterium]